MQPLPLGIDIGAARIRVADVRMTAHGPRLHNIAVREVAGNVVSTADVDLLSTLIDETVRELGVREKRCVCALGEPDAFLRPVHFPKMTHIERLRSAHFEAKRYVSFSADETTVRVHRTRDSREGWTLGIARSSAIAARTRALKQARLRPIAVDHEALALCRALEGYDAIIDIGLHRTNLHVPSSLPPRTLLTFSGGADITRAIAADLSIDIAMAEKRKRILGTAGAGERSLSDLVADLDALISQARATTSIQRVALVGNGARVSGLASRIASVCACTCEIPISPFVRPADESEGAVGVLAPDWTLATALSTWGLKK